MTQNDTLPCLAGLSPAKRRAVLALLGGAKNKSEAAEKAGIARRTLYRYLEDPVFQKALRKADGLVLKGTAAQLIAATQPAVEALRSVAEDSEARASDRIQAAAKILDYFLVHFERLIMLAP